MCDLRYLFPNYDDDDHICNHDGTMGCCTICGGYKDREDE